MMMMMKKEKKKSPGDAAHDERDDRVHFFPKTNGISFK